MGVFSVAESITKNLSLNIRKLKVLCGENIGIQKKKKYYQKVKWSDTEKTDFYRYWVNNYGKVIKPYWHKLYQSMNNHFDIEYLPEKLYTTELEPLLNPIRYCEFISDKSLLSFIFSGINEVRVPDTYFLCINGRLFDNVNNMVSIDDAYCKLSQTNSFVIKPTIESGSGMNVFVVNINEINREKFLEIVDQVGDNYIIQEKIVNNKEFSRLHPNSLNTIRVISYYINDEIHVAPIVMRIGVGDSNLDNIHSGGLSIGVNDNGTLKELAYELGYGDNDKTYSYHPTTNIKFFQYYIADTNKIKEAARQLHRRVPHLGIISWDLTMDDKDRIVLIEANCADQSVWFPQIVNACSLFGDDTAYFLNLLREARK